MDRIRALWRGEAPLWEAFWIWSVLVGKLLAFGADRLLPEPTSEELKPLDFLYVGLSLFVLVYMVFELVIIWRCAPNVNLRLWTILARIYVCANIAIGAYFLYRQFTRLEPPVAM